MRSPTTTRRTLLAAALAMPAVARAQAGTQIEFYFPAAVGGPITKIIDGYASDFTKENPDITVRPIYAGSYVDTLTKAVTATKAGSGPQLAVLLAVDAYTLADDELILPFDTVAQSADDKAWLNSFYPAFLRNGQIDGHTWGVPFQRSTIVLYWNKEVFKDAGLDPEKPPANWAEHTDFAMKTTKRDGDRTTRWGVQIPATGFAYWLFQALAIEAGAELANANGTKVNFNDPACVEALQYWIDLTAKHHAHPPGIVEWGTTPAQQAAALRFLKWITSPARAAQWGIDTGYVATRPDAWETEVMQHYVAGFPAAAVARDQLQFAVAELSTHDNQRVTQALDDELQAALTGSKAAKAALDDAQATATRLLQPYAR
jgi:sn-glycerol 3-phosphate transport system substrate-binding protein